MLGATLWNSSWKLVKQHNSAAGQYLVQQQGQQEEHAKGDLKLELEAPLILSWDRAVFRGG